MIEEWISNVYPDGEWSFLSTFATREEAIEDGREQYRERTCRMVECHDWCDEWEPYGIYCSECGEFVHGWFSELCLPIPDECPNCGAKVVEP